MDELRKIFSISVPPSIMEEFDKISKELGMTRSRCFEFIVMNMMKADKMPFGVFIETMLKEVIKKKK